MKKAIQVLVSNSCYDLTQKQKRECSFLKMILKYFLKDLF